MDRQGLLTGAEPSNSGADKAPVVPISGGLYPRVNAADAKHDIDVMLWSMKLCSIRRYFHQRFWENETQDAEYAEIVEPMPRLESVAEHSWHVADTVLLLVGHFPELYPDRCAQLAILHDKMEITIGDQNPVGRDGTGRATHAFNAQERVSKASAERVAIDRYLSRLRPAARRTQADALFELLDGATPEAQFVKAIDKLQALAFVLVKKHGELADRHLEFTLRYSEKVVLYFPPLTVHYSELRSRLLLQVARRRNCRVSGLEEWLRNEQLTLRFGSRDEC